MNNKEIIGALVDIQYSILDSRNYQVRLDEPYRLVNDIIKRLMDEDEAEQLTLNKQY